MDEVPFDLRSYRVQIYETHFDKIHKLKQSLKDIAEKHKSGSVTFGSPVIDFYPERREITAVVADANEVPHEEENPEDSEDKGAWDYAAEIEDAFGDMNTIVMAMGEVITEMGSKITGHMARLQMLNENPQPGAAGKKRQIFLLVASDMNQWAKSLEQDIPNFEKSIETLDESFSVLIELVELPSDEEEKERIISLRQTFVDFSSQVEAGEAGFRSLRDVVAGLKGISKDVNRASRRLAQAMDGIILNIEKVTAFAVRAVALMDDRFGDTGTKTSTP